MAYAQVAGLPPIAGLWAMLAPLAIYAVLGSSSRLSVGPDATTAVLTATAIGGLAAGDPSKAVLLGAMLALLVGAVCLVAFVLRLGFLADLLSRPLIVGYFAALGVIMVASQLEALTGAPVDGTAFWDQIRSFVGNFEELDTTSLLLGAAVLAFLLVVERALPRIPGPLIAVLGSTALVAWTALGDAGIATVGEIPAGLPVPTWPGVGADDVASMLPGAMGIALVAFSQNVLVARESAPQGRGVDPNEELLALGAANVGAGGLEGFPVSNSASRTVLAEAVGAKSQLTGLVTLVGLVVVMVFLRPLLASFPLPALGAIVVFAGIQLIRPSRFVSLGRFRRSELTLALATMVAVLATGILYGLLIAVAIAVLNVFRRVARPHSAVLGRIPGVPSLHDIGGMDDAETVPGLVGFRYDAPLCFANADDFRQRALEAVDEAPEPALWCMVNCEAIVDIDETAAEALESLAIDLRRRGTTLVLVRVKRKLHSQLEKAGLIGTIPEEHIFPTIPTALAAFESGPGATLTSRADPPPEGP